MAELSTQPVSTGKKQDSRFKSGQCGNPQGRPRGSRNRATKVLEVLLNGEAEAILSVVIEKARAGDLTAAKLFLDQVLPPLKDRPVTFDVSDIALASDAAKASGEILNAVSCGTLTPSEASEVMSIISAHVRILEVAELETRLAAPKAKGRRHDDTPAPPPA